MQQYFHLTGVLGRWLYAARRPALLERATGSKPLRWWLYLAVFRSCHIGCPCNEGSATRRGDICFAKM